MKSTLVLSASALASLGSVDVSSLRPSAKVASKALQDQPPEAKPEPPPERVIPTLVISACDCTSDEGWSRKFRRAPRGMTAERSRPPRKL